VLNDTLALFTGRQVAALVYNAQTASPETETVLNAAKENEIGVVPVTETLPANKDYLSWMDETITALATVLNSSAPKT
jgi:zinc/manganese transport system substrate-binding protein